MAVLNLTGYSVVEWDADRTVVVVAVAGISFIIFIGYVVLWFYWKGNNWARWLVLLTSALAVINLSEWTRSGTMVQIMIALEAPLGIFLLYWLNTTTAREFFDKNNVDHVPAARD